MSRKEKEAYARARLANSPLKVNKKIFSAAKPAAEPASRDLKPDAPPQPSTNS